MSGHTPGPWNAVLNGICIGPVGARATLATVWDRKGVDVDQQRADARLMAKAPEMHDALKASVSDHSAAECSSVPQADGLALPCWPHRILAEIDQ